MEKTTGVIISIGVALLLGVILVQIISTQTIASTQLSTASETHNLNTACYVAPGQVNASSSACNFTVTNAPTDWKIQDCPLSSVVVTNNSGTALTLSTDYNVYASTGIIQFLNTSGTNTTALGSSNNTIITYDYCGTGYINQSWERSVLNLVPGFFVLAILAAGIFVIFWILRENDIDFD